jgi:hypothetical protein
VPARSFEAPLTDTGSITDWAACDTCVEFINRNDWKGLERHAVKSFEARRGRQPQVVRNYFHTLYQQLRKNITGPPRRAK